MRLNEFTSPLNKYLITVKIDGVSVKSTIEAQSQSQASLLLGEIFGKKNVQSICSIAKNESKNKHRDYSKLNLIICKKTLHLLIY